MTFSGYSMPDFRRLWDEALTYEAFIGSSTKNVPLWEAVHRLSRLPAWAGAPERPLHLLVLAEDWCGDAVNTVPHLVRYAGETDGVDLRILRRDEHPEVMNRYLTSGTRSIPVVIVLDEEFQELGHWGPRPEELQAWVLENRETMEKSVRYPLIRRWYARDHGETTLREVLALAGPLSSRRNRAIS
jgi:hypothetical protein